MMYSHILVTGGTGFVGSHVVHQLLEAGYKVRAPVRAGKIGDLKNAFLHHWKNGKLDIPEFEDLTKVNFAPWLDGVDAVIHIASPGPRKGADKAQIIARAIEGAVGLMKSTISAGIKKFVYTSSIVALMDPGTKINATLDEKSWGVVKYEDIDLDALNEGGAYTLSKGLAEKKVWEIADKHPDVDVTTLLPPLIFGPFPPNVRIPKGFGISNAVLYQILTGGSDGPRTYPDFPVKQCVDVRDCAKTHLLALEAPPLPNGERKRLLTIAGDFNWEEATLFLREKRPELTSRLPSDEAIKKGAQTPLSFKFVQVNTEKALGLKQSEYKTWRQTFLDTIDMFTEYERASVSA